MPFWLSVPGSIPGVLPGLGPVAYNRVLLEQAQVLEAEVLKHAALFRIELGLTMRDVTPEGGDQALNA